MFFRPMFLKGYTSGHDTNNNFNQHCQKHALITWHSKFRPFDTFSSRVDNLTFTKFIHPPFVIPTVVDSGFPISFTKVNWFENAETKTRTSFTVACSALTWKTCGICNAKIQV